MPCSHAMLCYAMLCRKLFTEPNAARCGAVKHRARRATQSHSGPHRAAQSRTERAERAERRTASIKHSFWPRLPRGTEIAPICRRVSQMLITLDLSALGRARKAGSSTAQHSTPFHSTLPSRRVISPQSLPNPSPDPHPLRCNCSAFGIDAGLQAVDPPQV